MWATVATPATTGASSSSHTSSPQHVAPLLARGVFPTGGMLLAGLTDATGEEVSTYNLQKASFWEDLFNETQTDYITETPDDDGKGKPWLRDANDYGVPIQRVGQATFTSPEDSVYNVYTKAQFWAAIANNNEFYLKDPGFVGTLNLMADIDFGNETIEPIAAFYGILNGNGHKLSNFTITGSDRLGLISNLYGTVENLVIEKATVTASGAYNGVLVGIMGSGGLINNCLIKNCHLTGNTYTGMVVGMQNAGTINKNLVVNGTITCKTASSFGGIVGYIKTSATCTNNVSMLDMFQVQTKISKYESASFGRIYGTCNGTASNNYGWVETGFAVSDDLYDDDGVYDGDGDDYSHKFFPIWGDNIYLNSAHVDDDDHHGDNLFTGDYGTFTNSEYQSDTITFWESTLGFLMGDDWIYTTGDLYPVPKGSVGVSDGLIARRGYEHDHCTDYERDGENYIFTNVMLKKMEDGSALTGTAHLYTDVELSSGEYYIWEHKSQYSSKGYMFNNCSGNFNGHGHEFSACKNEFYDVRIASGGIFNAIEANAKIERLGVANIKNIGGLNTYGNSNVVGGLVGTSAGVVENCYVNISRIKMVGRPSYVGGLVGKAIAGDYNHNIVYLREGTSDQVLYAEADSYDDAIVAGLFPFRYSAASSSYNVVLAHNPSYSTHNRLYAAGYSSNSSLPFDNSAAYALSGDYFPYNYIYDNDGLHFKTESKNLYFNMSSTTDYSGMSQNKLLNIFGTTWSSKGFSASAWSYPNTSVNTIPSLKKDTYDWDAGTP